MWKCAAVVLVLVLAGRGSARANPGHEVTIGELSAQIQQTPEVPELYFQRAWNFREIGRMADARADWEKTLSLNPGFLPASRELARTDAAEGKPEAGIARLRQAMAAAPTDQAFHLPGCHSVLAELLLKQGQDADALQEAQAGLDRAPDILLDLCLLRSEAQRRLGRMDERVKDLAAAMTKLRSFVIKAKWYDAMIDAGRGTEILPEIDQEIGNTRYQATWLIRRARIRLKAGEGTGAAADLKAALSELETRLRPDTPDLSLICDRGLIYELQGNHAAALADLAMARQSGADFWMLMPLEALVGSHPRNKDGHPKKVLLPDKPVDEPQVPRNEK
jgi:tetratricopeptide (TPR) repeat protein